MWFHSCETDHIRVRTYKLSTWFALILFSGPSWVHSILHHWQTFYVTTGSQFHLYADDTQLYISFSTNSDLELTNTISKIEECLTDLDKWMPLNILQPIRIKLNFSLYFLPYSIAIHSSVHHHFASEQTQPSQSTRNFCVILDCTITICYLMSTPFLYPPSIICATFSVLGNF